MMYSLFFDWYYNTIFDDVNLKGFTSSVFNESIDFAEWLSHTASIISMIMFVVIMFLFIRWLFRLFGGLLSNR